MLRVRLFLAGIAVAAAMTVVPAGAQSQTQTPPPIPVPRPFPQPNQPSQPTPSTPPATTTPPKTPSQPTASAPSPAPVATSTPLKPTEAELGAPIYPASDFLDSYDAGKGQRYYLFGTNALYADIVAYYRNKLKDSGRELFKAPAMQQFDIGRFRDDTMVFPPSVTIKDYTWSMDGGSGAGYLFVNGTTEKRYRTIIQIVPAAGK